MFHMIIKYRERLLMLNRANLLKETMRERNKDKDRANSYAR